jgi:hypothetical protein
MYQICVLICAIATTLVAAAEPEVGAPKSNLCDVCLDLAGGQQALCFTYCKSEYDVAGRTDIATIRTQALGESDVRCLRQECLRYDPGTRFVLVCSAVVWFCAHANCCV